MSQETTLQHTHYKKFCAKDNSSIYAKVIWKDNNNDIFQIQIFDGDISWSGRFSREFGKQFSETTDNDEQDYYKNVKISLTEDSSEYVYEFTKSNSNSGVFTWKLKLGPTDTMVHGTVPVHKDEPPENTISLLDKLIEQNGKLINEFNTQQKSNKYMNEELKKYKNEMKDFINSKSTLERTMYGKFVNLLNTKKRRISLLEENIKKISSQSDVD